MYKRIIPEILSCIAALLILSGVFKDADLALSDRIYQRRQATDGNIVIVGIDQKALDTYGPYQNWDRFVIADAIDTLNRSHPAVIGLDIVYAGQTTQKADDRLVRAASAGNVVTASMASFGSTLVEDGTGGYALREMSVLSWEEPFQALREVTTQGHINSMYDTDGVVRHQLYQISGPDGRVIPSFARAVAEKYASRLQEPYTDKNGFWYLTYTGMPGDYYESISIADLLDGSVQPDYFAGKIVLIGPYAQGMQDSYITAIDHARPMYGVEIQANAIQALLSGRFRKEVPAAAQAVFLLAVLVICMRVFLKLAPWKGAVTAAGVCAVWFVFCRMASGYLFHVLWIPAGVLLLFAAALILKYVTVAVETKKVTDTFKRYVAPEVVTELLKEGTDALGLGGRVAEITVLFVDIRNFTSLSEALPPDQVVSVLNRYLSLVSSCILKNKGTLDKYIGDAAMAFWGAPLAQKDAAMSAVKAAVAMQEGAKRLSDETSEMCGRPLSFGIGIHCGEAVVGNIGSTKRMDYTAIGDTVNTAARLEEIAPGGRIYLSESVASALTGRIEVREAASAGRLKGKDKAVKVYELERIREEI